VHGCYRQTDKRDYYGSTALCTNVHCTVKRQLSQGQFNCVCVNFCCICTTYNLCVLKVIKHQSAHHPTAYYLCALSRVVWLQLCWQYSAQIEMHELQQDIAALRSLLDEHSDCFLPSTTVRGNRASDRLVHLNVKLLSGKNVVEVSRLCC